MSGPGIFTRSTQPRRLRALAAGPTSFAIRAGKAEGRAIPPPVKDRRRPTGPGGETHRPACSKLLPASATKTAFPTSTFILLVRWRGARPTIRIISKTTTPSRYPRGKPGQAASTSDWLEAAPPMLRLLPLAGQNIVVNLLI